MTKDTKKKDTKRSCPYCEGEIQAAKLPICKPCNVTLRYCTVCDTYVERDAEVCPKCGGKVELK